MGILTLLFFFGTIAMLLAAAMLLPLSLQQQCKHKPYTKGKHNEDGKL